ncbi:hypothetical protein Tco_0205492 [Tanacetum coccineum]
MVVAIVDDFQHTLALMCFRMYKKKIDKIDQYIGGLARYVQGEKEKKGMMIFPRTLKQQQQRKQGQNKARATLQGNSDRKIIDGLNTISKTFREIYLKLRNNDHGNQVGNDRAPAKVYVVGNAGENPDNVIAAEVMERISYLLAHVTAREVEDKSKKKRLEDVAIVRDFPEKSFSTVEAEVGQCTQSLHYLKECEDFMHTGRFKEGFGDCVWCREKLTTHFLSEDKHETSVVRGLSNLIVIFVITGESNCSAGFDQERREPQLRVQALVMTICLDLPKWRLGGKSWNPVRMERCLKFWHEFVLLVMAIADGDHAWYTNQSTLYIGVPTKMYQDMKRLYWWRQETDTLDKLARMYLKEVVREWNTCLNQLLTCPEISHPILEVTSERLVTNLDRLLPTITTYGAKLDGHSNLGGYAACLGDRFLDASRFVDRQKSYADLKRKPMEFQVGDKVMLIKYRLGRGRSFGKPGKLNQLHFVEEPVEIVGREVKRLKRSQIPLVKVRWNSKRGPEFTWKREDQFKERKYQPLHQGTYSRQVAAFMSLRTRLI